MSITLSNYYAPIWFSDALKEARSKVPAQERKILEKVLETRPQETPELDAELAEYFNAKRHEIIYAVCCLESYIFEWSLYEVLGGDTSKHATYFPEGQQRGITEKWKEIPKALFRDGLIAASPNLGNALWGDKFLYLIALRDALIHASVSRPYAPRNPDNILIPKRTVPPNLYSIGDIQLGWATKLVVDMITELNKAAGTQLPMWLEVP